MNFFKFENKSTKKKKQKQQDSSGQNLNCILVEESQEFISFTPTKEITNFENSLLYNKYDKSFKEVQRNQIYDYKPRTQKCFSFLLGIYEYQNVVYFIMIQNVEILQSKIVQKKIYRIKDLYVLNSEDLSKNQYLSSTFNDLLADKDFLFSYELNLMKNFKYQGGKKDSNNTQILYFLNWIFQKKLQEQLLFDWVNPIVFACYENILTKNFQLQDNCLLLQISSFLDLFKTNDSQNFILNSRMSQSFTQTQLMIQKDQKIFTYSFSLCEIPNKQQSVAKKFLENNIKKQENFVLFLSNKIDVNIHSFGGQCHQFDLSNEQYTSQIIQSILDNQYEDLYFFITFTQQEEVYTHIITQCLKFIILYHFYDQNLRELRNVKLEVNDFEFEIIQLLKKLRKGQNYYRNMLQNTQKIEDENWIDHFKDIFDLKSKKKQLQNSMAQIRVKNLVNYMLNIFEQQISYQVHKYLQNNISQDVFQDMKINILIHNCSGFMPQNKNKQKYQINYINIKELQQSDILIIGLQEILEMKSKNLKQIIIEDSQKARYKWRSYLEQQFSENFELIYSKNLLGLLVLILVKKSIQKDHQIKVFSAEEYRLGAFNLANKGFLLIKFSVNFQIITIANCHLKSGTNEIDCQKRIEQLEHIADIMSQEKTSVLRVIMGDLNFRNQATVEQGQQFIQESIFQPRSQYQQIINKYLKTEELCQYLQQSNKIFEQKINFLPSYKYKPNSDQFDFAQGKRMPSYTDRILILKEDLKNCKILNYQVDKQTMISDHKPVYLELKLKIFDIQNQEFKNFLQRKHFHEFLWINQFYNVQRFQN